MRSKLSERQSDQEDLSGLDQRVSLRDISDNDSLNSDDGKFLPPNYVSERDKRIEKNNKKKFKYGIRKRDDSFDEDEINRDERVERRQPKKENISSKPIPQNPKDDFKDMEEAIENYNEEENEEEFIKPPKLSNKSSIQNIKKSQVDSSDYYAESESPKKQSIKESVIVESELSVRDAADDNISASGSEMASPQINYKNIPNKKTVTFQKGQGTTPSSSDEKEEIDKHFFTNLATFKDHTNLSKY